MAIRPVLQLGDPLLRTVAEPVPNPSAHDVAATIADLKDTLAHWKATTTYGRGIAAPQIGVLRRVVFLNVDRPWPLINPEIVARSPETMVVWDACLSFLTIFFQVTRHRWIDVRYQDLDGTWHELRAEGDLSELLQHEIDHLDGILALDRITDLRTMCMREEFEKRHRADSPYATLSAAFPT
ncbi:MAG: peptide deformylase [Thermomicrobiales bacterium]|jgi:peptide deformylase|nr:peptide deformylase [Thermomicrobiales bacterium]